MKIEMCNEMVKLREELDKRNIEWEDKSTVEEFFTVYRTHFEYNNCKYSVIYGFGTYGGLNLSTKSNFKLLELMSEAVNKGEPVGYLTAEQVIEIVVNQKTTKRNNYTVKP